MAAKLILAATLQTVSAGYILTQQFSGPQCLGDPIAAYVAFPGFDGCLRTGATTSSRVECTNASFGVQVAFATSDCAGQGTTDNRNVIYPGCEATSGFSSYQQVCASGDFEVPAAAAPHTLAVTYYGGEFPGGSTCGSIQKATLTQYVMQPLDVCMPTSSTTSSRTQCNATHAVVMKHSPGCTDAGTVSGALPLGCLYSSGSTQVAVQVAVCGSEDPAATPADGLGPGPIAGITMGSIAATVAVALVGRLVWRRRSSGSVESSRLLV